MTEAQELITGLVRPPDGWTIDDLGSWPLSNVRYELTDGALTVSPSPTSLHQAVSGLLFASVNQQVPRGLAATQAVEIRMAPQLTRIPDVLVVRSEEPGRHWFRPDEVLLGVEIESPGSHIEDRITKPALYAQFGIPNFWRIELKPVRARVYELAGETYRERPCPEGRLVAAGPVAVDLALDELLPRWAR
jgi:Uma2 family endonuclease